MAPKLSSVMVCDPRRLADRHRLVSTGFACSRNGRCVAELVEADLLGAGVCDGLRIGVGGMDRRRHRLSQKWRCMISVL